jgi:hypothetical protein
MALELDDPAWSQLRTAYGPATEIPALLRALYGPKVADDTWEQLWSALCHQSDVYNATYAALSHIVAAARGRPALEQTSYLHFFAYALACGARPNAPGIPSEFGYDVADAMAEAAELALQGLRARPIDRDAVKIFCATVAAVRGDLDLTIDFLEAGETLTCPECDAAVPPASQELLGV